MKAWILAAAAALCLTACSKPSEGEAKQALADLMAQSASAPVVTIEGFSLTGCTRADDTDGYRCDTRGTVIMDLMGNRVPLPVDKNLRYAKADGTWRAYAQ
ncbi:hypothetical protein HH110_04310 [Stenotrophomonas sp. SAM-B]|uniref:hypothetical protein n=1 Tax=Stenotrophomonas sp. SAM-B TaxID=2729141 RepID=UPI0015A19DC8|nr:hypothetical protein [Stenotrophomonas sp. SAM-B]NWF32270.1 hypothetical protein [Stenotrophomonas sp. SAM-B]